MSKTTDSIIQHNALYGRYGLISSFAQKKEEENMICIECRHYSSTDDCPLCGKTTIEVLKSVTVEAHVPANTNMKDIHLCPTCLGECIIGCVPEWCCTCDGEGVVVKRKD